MHRKRSRSNSSSDSSIFATRTCPLRQPPSIYLTKRAGDVGYIAQGLTAQLFVLADTTRRDDARASRRWHTPRRDEPLLSRRTASMTAGRPTACEGQRDMKAVRRAALEYLAARLEQMAIASLSRNFQGDRRAVRRADRQASSAQVLAKRYDRRREPVAPSSPRRAAARCMRPAIVTSAAQGLREVPRHNFHPS